MTYRVVRRLGRGGMGVVDLAIAPDGTEVALKRLSLHGTPDEIARARARIRREAEVLGSLDHPGIVRLIDLLDDGDDVVLVMPYLPGGSLHDRVAQGGPLDPQAVRAMADPLLDALAAAHRQGIVHRDIKPENVLFSASGQPQLVDFGVARASDHTPGLTATSMVVGTPGFMAPEQARGEPASAAADIFSLGATLLFAATGEGPFGPPATDARVLMHRAALGRIERPPKELPAELRGMLIAALDRNPDRRPSAARLRGGVGGTSPLTGLVDAVARKRVVVAVAAGVALVVIAALVGAVVIARSGGEDGDRAAPTTEASTTTEATTTTTEPCVPRPYQPCGPDGLGPIAPNTDGDACLDDFEDYDGDPLTGCEAEPDDLGAAPVLADGATLRATIVPRDDIDRFILPVTDGFDLTCSGSVTVTLRSPPGMVLELVVSREGEQLRRVVVEGGQTGSVSIGERCGTSDEGELTATVRAVGSDRVAEEYAISRRGDF